MFAKSLVFVCCMSLSRAALLYSNATSDPKCVKVETASNLDMNWAMKMFGGQDFVIPMASTQAVVDFSEMFLGKATSSAEELAKMCPEARIRGITLTIRGYEDRFMVHTCYIIKSGIQDCKVSAESEFPQRHKKADAIQTLSWTDNVSGMVMVRCVPGGKNDWTYYSTEKTISDKNKQDVLDHVKHLGLDSTNIYMTPYGVGKC